jgi:hypothetical protein
MGLDLRLPLGLMFLALGAILVIVGLINDPTIYARTLDVDVNLVWGICLAVFGAAMLWLAHRGARAAATAPAEPPAG